MTIAEEFANLLTKLREEQRYVQELEQVFSAICAGYESSLPRDEDEEISEEQREEMRNDILCAETAWVGLWGPDGTHGLHNVRSAVRELKKQCRAAKIKWCGWRRRTGERCSCDHKQTCACPSCCTSNPTR